MAVPDAPPEQELSPLPLSPAERLSMWRTATLLEAGFSPEQAGRLADSAVDLHVACDLLRNGCAPELAEDILT